MKYTKRLLLITFSFIMLNAMESIVSVSSIKLSYSEGYAATLRDGNKIEVTRCIMPGPLNGIVRLSLLNSNMVAKGDVKFRGVSANEWFKKLKDMREEQQQK